MVRFMKKHKPSYLVIIFYYVIDTVYICSLKQIYKNLNHLGDALCKKYIFYNRTWCST